MTNLTSQTKPKQETKLMRKQTGSRNRGWLPSIGNRLSVAAGVALVAGIMGAFAPRAEAALATGGTVTNYTTGTAPNLTNWTAHIFTNSGTLTVYGNRNVEVLVVGGGGGGGHAEGGAGGDGGGGGGAGGYVYSNSVAVVASSNYTVTVGIGGNGSANVLSAGGNGSNSVFGAIVAYGGGGGGSDSQAGVGGGSGGGAGSQHNASYNGGSSTNGQGYKGGDAAADGTRWGAGGGGASAEGASKDAGSKGGDGKTNTISGSSVPYAGGGGGGGRWADAGAAGGSGGGGAGGNPGGPGAANTGGGGGGGQSVASGQDNGGNGGSGIVIVRYLALSVSLTTPANGSLFTNGTTSLSATGTVVGGSTNNYTVTFYTNSVGGGGYAEAGTSGPGPGPSFSVTLTGLADNSTNYIYAVAVDSSGTTNTSATNTFYLVAPFTPTVSVSAPTNNQTFAFRSTVMATGTVSGIGPFTVVFYTNKNSGAYGTAGSVSGIPGQTNFALSLGTLDNGTNGIYAVVTDNVSQVAYSLETNTFYVSKPAVPSVSIRSPTNNQVFASGTSITATGTVTGVGTPLTVTFYTNKNSGAFGLAGTFTNSGSGSAFTNAQALGALGWGTYGVSAVVTDVANQAATSTTNTFFVAGVLPVISNRGPTEVTTGSATFNGFLSTTGNPPPSVYVFYSMTNNVWSFTNALTAPGGVWTNNSPLSTNITGLASGRTWYYTFGASNAAPVNATVVASPATNLITGEVTVQATITNTQYRLDNRTNGQFTIYRPATATNEALTVSYTMSGTATNGTHYTLSPAASVTFAAGTTSTVVTVTPYLVLGSSVDAILTLTASASNNYLLGTASNATVTILAVDVTPTAPYTAWGGDVRSTFTKDAHTSSQKVYAVHQYTNTAITGYFVPSTRIKNVEVLVVAGGGGGGHAEESYGGDGGGGGGAGGYVYSNSVAVVAGSNYTVTVGIGGNGSTNLSSTGGNGSNSVFGAIVAYGGGGGGSDSQAGVGGGSGGGAGSQHNASYIGGSSTNGQGYKGGDTAADGTRWGAGGGGASAEGASKTAGSKGGDGKTNTISGSSVPYAGGGGGGGRYTDAGAAGGSGGGGAGGNPGGPGADNTGGGGGGGRAVGTGQGNGGNGGSGIVIVRYELIPPKGTLFMMR
jgi:hypothetical protein